MMHKEEHRSDAVRSEPILFDGHGGKFWRLKGYTSEMDILLQGLFLTSIFQTFGGFKFFI